jgi:hypothetical protein
LSGFRSINSNHSKHKLAQSELQALMDFSFK